jgi:hypothetical protein
MVMDVEVTADEIKDPTQGPDFDLTSSVDRRLVEFVPVCVRACVRACRASILKAINIEKVEIQRIIEPQGVRANIRTFRRRCRGRIIPMSGCGGELLDVTLGFCYLLSLDLNSATGSLGLGR